MELAARATMSGGGLRRERSSLELSAALIEWSRRGALQWVTVGSVSVVIVVAMVGGAGAARIVELTTYSALVLLLVRFLEQRRRRIFLEYELDADEATRVQGLDDALRDVARDGVVYGMHDATPQQDWERTVGTSHTVLFEKAELRRASLPHVVTNPRTWSASFKDRQLMFLPDGLLMRFKHGELIVYPYEQLQVIFSEEDLSWGDELPEGATVVGKRWLYVSEDGGPDRRFNGNVLIPVIRTASLSLLGPNGLDEKLQTTALSAARRVSNELQRAIEAAQRDVARAAQALAAPEDEGGGKRSVPMLRFSSRPPVSRLRSAETWMSVAALLLASLVFLGARGMEAEKNARERASAAEVR